MLRKTNGGVEPWGSQSPQQQSALKLEPSDEDEGPLLVKRSLSEFLLRQDTSVQKMHTPFDLQIKSNGAQEQSSSHNVTKVRF